jgi:hypothetical protein
MRKMMIAVAEHFPPTAVSGVVISAEALGAAFAACMGSAAYCTVTVTATATAVTPSRPTATLGSAPETGWCPYWAPLLITLCK